MNELVKSILDPNEIQLIKTKLYIQMDQYGVYEPPKLKQLISLRHLLIRTGFQEDLRPEFFAGFSKVECNELLKKLNKMYLSQRRKNIKAAETIK